MEINKKRKPDNKGYVALYNEWQAKINSIDTLPAYTVDSNKITAFQDFINLAKKSGAKLFVISSSIFLKFNRSQDIDICKDVCSFENVPFWDFSKDKVFFNKKRLFQDVSHLNHNGAIIFSNLVVDKIKHEMASPKKNM